eukprot:scaffold10249_cov59-Cyclotella_meneghiniana.AAC.18
MIVPNTKIQESDWILTTTLDTVSAWADVNGVALRFLRDRAPVELKEAIKHGRRYAVLAPF